MYHPSSGICDHDLIIISLNLTEKPIRKSSSYTSHAKYLLTHLDIFPTPTFTALVSPMRQTN